jgi:hypothetical protein
MLFDRRFAKTRQRPCIGRQEKSRAIGPAKVEVRQNVKTFQRERLIRQRREEESGATLKSANAHIGGIAPVCNAACLMKGLRCMHGLAMCS